MSRRKKDDDNGFEKWGNYMEAKKMKLEEQFCLDARKHSTTENADQIFRNIAIFVNGFTNPSADELKQLMIKHGGIYHHYYRSEKTTHFIASNLPDTKIKQLKGMKVVKPEWIVHSIAQGRLLDYRLYLLYTNQSKTQPKLFIQSNHQRSNNSDNLSDTQIQGNSNDIFSSNSNINENCKKISSSAENSKEGPRILNTHNTNKDPNIKHNIAKTASEASFLSEFYSNSRLHHISTMGAIFKQYVYNLHTKNLGDCQGIHNFIEWLRMQPTNKTNDNINDCEINYMEEKKYKSVIMHIDMDCFFVSVGLKKRPELKGCPVSVTHAKSNSVGVKRSGMDRSLEFNLYKERKEEKFMNSNKTKIEDSSDKYKEIKPFSDWVECINETDSMSEIASCNYEARKAGVTNGMFLGQALKLCPNLKTIPYDFEAYKEVSYTLYNTVASYTLNIEAVSCDEMFVDCTEILHKTSADPLQFASFLRQEIKDKTGCSCSTGFGSNRLQARLATKKAKPDGQFYMMEDDVIEFMKIVKVSDIPGVGRATSYKLSQLGITTCLDLQQVSLSKLQGEFGKKTGETLFKNCRGQDDRSLSFKQERKSVSAEVNYGIRFENQLEADNFLKQLSAEVHSRLHEVNKGTRCITLKLMIRAKDAPEESAKFLGHGICDYTTKSSTLNIATAESNIILREVLSLSKQLNINPRELRGIGIQLTRLEDVKKTIKLSKDSIDKFLVPQNEERNSIKKQEITSMQNLQIKDASVTNCTRPKKPSSDNTNKFFEPKKFIHKMKNEMKSKPNHIYSGTIDKDVLESLPEDIRREVLEEYGLNDNNLVAMGNNEINGFDKLDQFSGSCKASTSKDIDSEFRKQLKGGMNNQASIDNVTGPRSSESKNDKGEIDSNLNSLSLDLSLTEIRTLIREWISSEEIPLERDINMLANYLRELVVLRQLENLDIAVRCLYRCIATRKSEEWQNAYFNIVNKVQDVMSTVYGAKLFIENKFQDVG